MPAAPLVPPDAPRRPSSRTVHGDEVTDDYAWMADRDDPVLLAYLQAENDYAVAKTAHLASLEREIYEEIRARTKETDLSVPVRHGGWWYYSRTIEGEQYAVEARVPEADHPTRPALVAGAAPDGEQVILDENAEARGHDFFSLGASDVSPDGRLLAFAVDVVGDERFDLRIRDIGTGELLDEAVRGIGYGVAWSIDGRHVFYTRVDATWRPHEVWRHAVGRPAEEDVRVLHEEDPRFAVGVGTSLDDQWVVFGIGSKTTSECLLLAATDPTGTPWSVAPRRDGVEYDVTLLGDELLVVHNADRSNFEVARAVVGLDGASAWQPLAVTTPDEYVTGVEAFVEFVVVSLRVAGQSAVRILPRDPLSDNGFGRGHDVQFDEPVRSVSTGDNPEAATPTVQLTFSSLVTPATVYDYDVTTRELTVLKRKEVLGGYDPTDYRQRLEWVQTTDGALVPLSLVHHVDTPLD
ncbi:MAG: oligopeptidase B, partial [Actinomycetota bacterium]|nr:oligopeptidase B [Actinomycetota bacterium]